METTARRWRQVRYQAPGFARPAGACPRSAGATPPLLFRTDQVTDQQASEGVSLVSESTVALISVVASSLVALIIVFVQQELQRRGQERQARAQRLSAFATSAWTSALFLENRSRVPADRVEAGRNPKDVEFNRVLDALNDALNVVYLLEPVETAKAARDVDERIIEMSSAARRGPANANSWQPLWNEFLFAYEQYLQVARERIGRDRLPWSISEPG